MGFSSRDVPQKCIERSFGYIEMTTSGYAPEIVIQKASVDKGIQLLYKPVAPKGSAESGAKSIG